MEKILERPKIPDQLFVAQERANQSLLIVTPLCISATTNTRQVMGATFSPIYLGFKRGTSYIVGGDHGFDQLGHVGIQQLRKDPQLVKKCIKRYTSGIIKMNAFTAKVFTNNLRIRTNHELLEIFETFKNHYIKTFPFGEPISWAVRFDFVKDLEQKIATHISDRTKLNDAMATLISPSKPSFVNEEEEALLNIIADIQEDERLVDHFRENLNVISARLVMEYPEINHRIDEHTRAFCWVPYDYESVIWDKEHFIATIKDIVTKNIDARDRLRKLRRSPRELEEKKAKIIRDLKLDAAITRDFEAVADAGYLLDYKKAHYSLSHYHMRPWFEEVARRLSLTIRQVRYMLPADLEEALIHNRIDRKVLDERYEYCVIEVASGHFYPHYREDAKRIFAKFETRIDEGKTEIQGTCAQPGTVRGAARVLLSAHNIAAMQDGEILITMMTTPDFVPAMRKAKAIVTDEGGITSHAAIISRELGIPCIVGTKVATKFFKTGDFIEIHAANGIVRKLGGKP